jgi:hypothetical protein
MSLGPFLPLPFHTRTYIDHQAKLCIVPCIPLTCTKHIRDPLEDTTSSSSSNSSQPIRSSSLSPAAGSWRYLDLLSALTPALPTHCMYLLCSSSLPRNLISRTSSLVHAHILYCYSSKFDCILYSISYLIDTHTSSTPPLLPLAIVHDRTHTHSSCSLHWTRDRCRMLSHCMSAVSHTL